MGFGWRGEVRGKEIEKGCLDSSYKGSESRVVPEGDNMVEMICRRKILKNERTDEWIGRWMSN